MAANVDRDLFDFKRVFVVLSNVCNCRCVMCNNRHHSLGRSSLSFEDVQQVARFALENQVEVLDFSGGEPFQFPHIARLIKECAGSEMILNIVTNGTIMTGDHLKAVAEAPNLRLQVSTHGLGDVEDAIKRRPSASRQVDKTLDRLMDAGAAVSLATVVQKQNLGQLVDIYRHFSALPYTHHSFVMYEPMGDTPPEHIDPTDVRITPDRAEELRTQMTAVIEEARVDGKVINLDPALVEKYVERVLRESPLSAKQVPLGATAAADAPVAADAALTPPASPPVERALSHPGLLCTIPRRNLFIDHNGDVRPCFHFDWQALNSRCSIADRPIGDLVSSPEYRDMVLTAIGPNGCPGCDAACYIWDPDFRRRATDPNADDKALALMARRFAGMDPRVPSGGDDSISLATATARAAYLDDALRQVELSTSWRLTAPLRRLRRAARRK